MAEATPTTVLHKHPKTRGYVQIENGTIRDGRLSFRATGLLAHLLSLPNGANIGSVHLAKKRPEGRVAIQNAYRELREFGYVTQERVQGKDGTWRTVTHVFEVPATEGRFHASGEPKAGLPPSAEPTSVDLPVSPSDFKTDDEKNKGEVSHLPGVWCAVCNDVYPDVDAYTEHIMDGTCPGNEGYPEPTDLDKGDHDTGKWNREHAS